MIRVDKPEEFKRCVAAISTFISEGNLRFNERGISLRAVDPTQIVLVNFNIPKNYFQEFKVEPSLVGVDLSELNKILQRSAANDSLEMNLTESELAIRLKGDVDRNFRLPLIDVSDEEPTLPEKGFDAQVNLPARTLKEILKDAGLFSSSVMLRAASGKFSVESKGSTGQVKSVLGAGEKVKVKATTEASSKYSVGFLSNIVKETVPEQELVMSLKSDSPVKIEYSLGPALLQFYLAHML